MIAVRSSHDPDHLRGEGLDLAVLDEAAFMEARVWPEIIRPMLATTQGPRPLSQHALRPQLVLGSVPPGPGRCKSPTGSRLSIPQRQQRTHRAGRAGEHPPADLRAGLAHAEYLAEFDDDQGQVFRGIRAAVRPLDCLAPLEGHRYVAGVDWGRSIDYTAIAIIDATARPTGGPGSLQPGRLELAARALAGADRALGRA